MASQQSCSRGGCLPYTLVFGNLHCLGPWSMCDLYQSLITAEIFRAFLLPVVQPLGDLKALTLVTSDWLCNYLTCMDWPMNKEPPVVILISSFLVLRNLKTDANKVAIIGSGTVNLQGEPPPVATASRFPFLAAFWRIYLDQQYPCSRKKGVLSKSAAANQVEIVHSLK